ncbi:DUF3160 domain-containing protein [Methanocella sp. MCL-LM]|uniref:DUF3160 domain-containing protein n=1 Tax=Methanocella sp. MCL-LM TaxID=3412035 RepID=UPI003C76CD78
MIDGGMNRRKFLKAAGAASALFFGSSVLGCISADTKTPGVASGTSPTYTITGSVETKFAEFAPMPVSVRPSLAGYSVSNLSAVAGAENISFDNGAKALLTQNLFIARPSRYEQVYEIYKHCKDAGTPVIVTSDSVLHTYHILFDYLLRILEVNKFSPAAIEMTSLLLAESMAQLNSGIPELKDLCLKNVAFFAVAQNLLTGSWDGVPSEARSLAEAELKLIDAHEGFADSPIFGRKEDYSQYVPRGHYTRNDTLKKYFKALMWYGRMSFNLYKEGLAGAEPDMDSTRRAIMVTLALKDRALDLWKSIYDPTVFFVGETDDLSIYDYMPLIREVYGSQVSLADLKDDSKVLTFIEKAAELKAPKIISGLIVDTEDKKVLKGFRLMGQRFIPDSYIFQGLVYDKVGTRDNPRTFPMGLDVMGVLGSARAYEILDKVYKQTEYLNYKEQFEALKAEFATLDAADWTQNLYWCWLYSLLSLLNEKGEGYPSFMTNQAWVDKDLNTALGSWTELRHDTILYAKQSYAVLTSAVMPPKEEAKGYVEPNAELYGRLASLTKMTIDGLTSRGLLADEFSQKLDNLYNLLTSLKAISEKELAGTALSTDEYSLIKNIGGSLESITTFSAETSEAIESEADKKMAVVADVHTDPNTGQVLEEGVGKPYELLVIVPIEGTLTLVTGAAFSYYEFKHPMSDRLTDEAWQAMLAEGREPEPPEWTKSFVA